MLCKILAFVGLLLLVSNGQSLSFGNTQGSNMVLQQAPYMSKIWGKASAGSTIDVRLTLESTGNTIDTVSATTDSNGYWSIYFKPIAASNDVYSITATTGKESVSMKNILFGDVFICGGQSNMQFTVDSAFNASEEVQAANNYPMIRLFTATQIGSSTPQIELLQIEEPWSVASNITVGGGNWSYMSAMVGTFLSIFFSVFSSNNLYPLVLVFWSEPA